MREDQNLQITSELETARVLRFERDRLVTL
nr:MAG TPA: hypothetical protein [Caudoviricetes sp.]